MAGDYGHLLPQGWNTIVNAWFQEDCHSFDYAGYVVGETEETATLYGKSRVSTQCTNSSIDPYQGVLAGRPFVDEIFRQLGCSYFSFRTFSTNCTEWSGIWRKEPNLPL